ncbi:MAG TPA: sulfite exporter TauE/SafE family protein [Anaeromyxobacteraceae bacterium]|nr:sulfite exporter TauE/SafE family protein [Anaeromyxobacteraceae bacterium]
MTPLLLAAFGFCAGLFGALMGVGGGLLVIPALTHLAGLRFSQAVAVSLTAIIVSSSASSASYVEKGLTDIRTGVVLELATVAGAVAASLLSSLIPQPVLLGLFALVAYYTAFASWRRRGRAGEGLSAGEYPVRRWGAGLAMSFAAGATSGLVGVGGGFLKVPAMSLVMGLPFKVATATSNFMIGVTAAASAYVYAARGELDLAATAPTVVGVYAGARLGARLLPHIPSARLQGAFAAVLAVVGTRIAFDAWSLLR